jgi:hypothetical protein
MLKNPRDNLSTFYRAYDNIKKYEESQRTNVDLTMFLLANFDRHKKSMLPFKMLSPYSMRIYRAFCDSVSIPTRNLTPAERIRAKEKLVHHLAESWDLSVEEIKMRFSSIL